MNNLQWSASHLCPGTISCSVLKKIIIKKIKDIKEEGVKILFGSPLQVRDRSRYDSGIYPRILVGGGVLNPK